MKDKLNKENNLEKEVQKLKDKLNNAEFKEGKLMGKISSLEQEVKNMDNLAKKCVSLEKQLKEAEKAIKTIDANLKTSENKRYTLSKQLEERIQDSSVKARKFREQFGSAPLNLSNWDNSITIIESDSKPDFLQEVNTNLSKVFDSFKYHENLVTLSLKEDKQLQDICKQLQKFNQWNNHVFGFINNLANIISLKLTCEKFIQITSLLEKPFSESSKRLSSGNKLGSPKSNTLKSERKGISRNNSKKKQVNYYSTNKSTNGFSQMEDSESIPFQERSRNEMKFFKPSLRKNVYASLTKKNLNDRKASSPGNYSVLTDNFISKIDDSLAIKYISHRPAPPKETNYKSSTRNKGLKLPKSTYKSSSKVLNKNGSKLPISKSVKNMRDKGVPKPIFHPRGIGMKSPRDGMMGSFKSSVPKWQIQGKVGISSLNKRKYLNMTGLFSTRNSILHSQSVKK